MQTITISGQARTDLGKVATKADRAAGRIPCVMYAGNEVVHFTSSLSELRGILYTPKFFKAIISIDGTTHEALLKDVQVHPITEEIRHVDFLKLLPGVKVIADIPIRVVGSSQGVREGGKLLIKIRKVKVKTTPESMKDSIEVDISPLRLGQSFKVKDLPDQGFEILTSPSIPLVSVEITRALKSAATDAAKAEASAKKK